MQHVTWETNRRQRLSTSDNCDRFSCNNRSQHSCEPQCSVWRSQDHAS